MMCFSGGSASVRNPEVLRCEETCPKELRGQSTNVMMLSKMVRRPLLEIPSHLIVAYVVDKDDAEVDDDVDVLTKLPLFAASLGIIDRFGRRVL